MAGHIARMKEKKDAYSILVGKLDGERSLGRPGRKILDRTVCYGMVCSELD
jgi:hypothetical protein